MLESLITHKATIFAMHFQWSGNETRLSVVWRCVRYHGPVQARVEPEPVPVYPALQTHVLDPLLEAALFAGQAVQLDAPAALYVFTPQTRPARLLANHGGCGYTSQFGDTNSI